MPKKKFINRKKAVSFHLVHRSQQDPLTADETAPQRVLIPIQQNNTKSTKENENRVEEQHKYGIFFDDDYNYLQHLRDVTRTVEWVSVESKHNVDGKLHLPSSVFASNVEEDIGLLNKAAPQSGLRLDLDPDIIAAMDEDFNFNDPENELDDNFMELANAEISNNEYEDIDEERSNIDSDFNDSEALDEVASLEGPQYSFKDEETKSRFTEYSMSSSVMKRNEQLILLDDRFEQMYAAYHDTEIGALDCEEIEGHIADTADILLQYADEFEKNKQKEQLNQDDAVLRFCLQDSDSDYEETEIMEVAEKEKWDCESVLSTYSNIHNHPKLITEPKKTKIKINPRTGMPLDVLNSNKLTAKALSKLNEYNEYENKKNEPSVGVKSIISTLSALSIRPKDELLEDKKERKRLVREYRRERRQEKKLNSLAFKEESKKQSKILNSNRTNIQGNKIV